MSSLSADAPLLPPRLEALSAGAWTRIAVGQSGATVWRLAATPDLVLKSEVAHAGAELPGEASRLRWMHDAGLAAPEVRDAFEQNGRHWLLMTALSGADLTHLVHRPGELLPLLAQALRHLHDLDPSRCPFDYRLDARIAAGADNFAAGRVDETDFDDDRLGWTGADVLDWLATHRPPTEHLVVTHGDATLPNIIAGDGLLSGFVDCGRLGVADRWQDLALACRSIIYNCGPAHVAPFLAAYGAGWDEARYRYYCTLDELF